MSFSEKDEVIYVETKLTGAIIYAEMLDYEDAVIFGETAILEVVLDLDEYEYKQMEAEGLSDEEIQESRFVTEPLIERDREPDVMRVKTSDGIFFIVAQEQDGHGRMMTVKAKSVFQTESDSLSVVR